MAIAVDLVIYLTQLAIIFFIAVSSSLLILSSEQLAYKNGMKRKKERRERKGERSSPSYLLTYSQLIPNIGSTYAYDA